MRATTLSSAIFRSSARPRKPSITFGLPAPPAERVSLAQLTDVKTEDGAEEVYREAGERYVAIKYSVRDRDLGSTVEEAIRKVNAQVKLPTGYKLDWAGEYESCNALRIV